MEDVETEIEKIEWCDLMSWQFPLWWFELPGILKGWVDRVCRPIHRGMLQFVGFEVLALQITYGPVRMDNSQRKQLLAAYADRLKNTRMRSRLMLASIDAVPKA